MKKKTKQKQSKMKQVLFFLEKYQEIFLKYFERWFCCE